MESTAPDSHEAEPDQVMIMLTSPTSFRPTSPGHGRSNYVVTEHWRD